MELEKGKIRLELAAFLLLAVMIYKTGILLFLFMAPLLWVRFKYGERWFLAISGGFLLALLGTGLVFRGGIPADVWAVLLFLEIAIVGLLLFGAWAISSDYRETRVYKSLMGILCIAVLSIPVILVIMRSAEFRNFLAATLQELHLLFGMAPEGQSDDGQQMLKLFGELFFRNYLASMYVLITVNYYLTGKLYGSLKRRPFGKVKDFRLNDTWIWFLIIGFAGIIVSRFTDIGFFSYLFWNAGLIFLYLYGVQGLGIIIYLLDRYAVSRGIRNMLVVGAVLGLFLPGINMALFFGIPVLGASEVWIHYRKERSNGHEGHIE